MKTFKVYSILFFILSLSCFSCKEKTCEEGCSTGFFCEEETCICPEGKIQFGENTCRELSENELFGMPGEAGCSFCEMENMAINLDPDRGLTFSFDQGFKFMGNSNHRYFELPSGDSIAIGEIPSFRNDCRKDGELVWHTGLGKYNPAKDTLKMWIKFRPSGDSVAVDSCFYLFHK